MVKLHVIPQGDFVRILLVADGAAELSLHQMLAGHVTPHAPLVPETLATNEAFEGVRASAVNVVLVVGESRGKSERLIAHLAGVPLGSRVARSPLGGSSARRPGFGVLKTGGGTISRLECEHSARHASAIIGIGMHSYSVDGDLVIN